MDESIATRIIVVYANDALKSRADRVAALLNAPLQHIDAAKSNEGNRPQGQSRSESSEGTNTFYLEVGATDSQLTWNTPQAGKFRISFTEGANGYRRTRASPRSDTLARAIGLNRQLRRAQIADWSVLDATAGACTDTWAMAAFGCRVLAFERSGCLHVLQMDALRQAISEHATRECASRVTLINADAGEWLSNLGCHSHNKNQNTKQCLKRNAEELKAEAAYLSSAPDVIYIDPMYPQRKKSAAVKKGMQTLQRLLGPDNDSKQLLDAALSSAARLKIKRVVVKRPAGAGRLSNSFGIEPAHIHESKNTRYDVYLYQSLKF